MNGEDLISGTSLLILNIICGFHVQIETENTGRQCQRKQTPHACTCNSYVASLPGPPTFSVTRKPSQGLESIAILRQRAKVANLHFFQLI